MKLYRHWFERDSLRKQLLTWVLVPMTFLLLLNIGLYYKLGHDSANRRHDKFLFEASKILLDQLRSEQGIVKFDIHSGALNMLYADKIDEVYYSLSWPMQEYPIGYPDLPAPHARSGSTPHFYLADYAGQPVRMMDATMPDADVPGGLVEVRLAKTLNIHHERTQEWIWRVLPAQLFLIMFAGGLVWWGVGRGLRPLVQMRDEVSRRSPHDLSPLQADTVVAEVRPLIDGFNQLLGRLEISIAQQKRFVADAAHQLRTPIAGMKAQAELALQLNDPAEIRHSLRQIQLSTEQTAHLVQQLLSLARTEPEAQGQSSMQGIDLTELVTCVTTSWVDAALKKDIDLGLEAEEHVKCTMLGNRFLLAEMMNNLLDNALRYTPNHGWVTVRMRVTEERSIIEVEDSGIGIPENLRERVFERFYRVLGSDQPGCGLGLAIVREIVTYHAGSITVLSGAQGRGTLFRLEFPKQIREATRQLPLRQ